MANASQLQISETLTQFASAYSNKDFIADIVCPVISVDSLSGRFATRNKFDEYTTAADDLVGPKGSVNRVSYSTGTDTFTLEGRALEDVVDYTQMQAVNTPLNPEQLAVSNVMNAIMRKHELRVATVMTTSGNYASSNTFASGTPDSGTAAAWTDTSNSRPVRDIQYALEQLPFSGEDQRIVGFCSDLVYNALARHPELLALMGLGDRGLVSKSLLAEFFGIDDLIVSRIGYSSTNPGQSSKTYARAWGTTVFGLTVIPRQTVSTEQQMFAASFRHRSGVEVFEWEDMSIGAKGGKRIKVSHYTQAAKVIQNDSAALITGVR
ncbi:MAG: hypothetical protein IPK80_02685 [Nannocystis sp.]|nr:hypothetical protein [Nannocystis sp.]